MRRVEKTVQLQAGWGPICDESLWVVFFFWIVSKGPKNSMTLCHDFFLIFILKVCIQSQKMSSLGFEEHIVHSTVAPLWVVVSFVEVKFQLCTNATRCIEILSTSRVFFVSLPTRIYIRTHLYISCCLCSCIYIHTCTYVYISPNIH